MNLIGKRLKLKETELDLNFEEKKRWKEAEISDMLLIEANLPGFLERIHSKAAKGKGLY